MISKFFIERPVLTNVLAIIMILLGAVALFNLPVAQYPDVVPPTGAGYEWTDWSYQEKAVGRQLYVAFALALVLVYLLLAGQYELVRTDRSDPRCTFRPARPRVGADVPAY